MDLHILSMPAHNASCLRCPAQQLAFRAPRLLSSQPVGASRAHRSLQACPSQTLPRRCGPLCAQKTDEPVDSGSKSDPASTTEKWGLEAGLFKVFTSKEEAGQSGKSKGQQAKDLLARYGSAYLITSISFALVSFGACYALVSSGVDVAALLGRVGLQVSGTSEKVGTFAIAYAAHKALSPVRFPPTVALTPVVARILGKEPDNKQPPPPEA